MQGLARQILYTELHPQLLGAESLLGHMEGTKGAKFTVIQPGPLGLPWVCVQPQRSHLGYRSWFLYLRATLIRNGTRGLAQWVE